MLKQVQHDSLGGKGGKSAAKPNGLTTLVGVERYFMTPWHFSLKTGTICKAALPKEPPV